MDVTVLPIVSVSGGGREAGGGGCRWIAGIANGCWRGGGKPGYGGGGKGGWVESCIDAIAACMRA